VDRRIKSLIEGRNFGHIATARRDGSAAVNPIWVDLEEDVVLINGTKDRAWTANVGRDPRVTLSVCAISNPYECATLRGTAHSIDTDPIAHFDRLFRKYRGAALPAGTEIGDRVLFSIAVERTRYRFEPPPGSGGRFDEWLASQTSR
jgi:PPOX class probable F420-dependent enzyme